MTGPSAGLLGAVLPNEKPRRTIATGACFPETTGLRDDRPRCLFGRHAAPADGPTAVSDCQGERNARSAARPKPAMAPRPFAAPRRRGANRNCPAGSCLPSSVRCADACRSVDPKARGVSRAACRPRRTLRRSTSADAEYCLRSDAGSTASGGVRQNVIDRPPASTLSGGVRPLFFSLAVAGDRRIDRSIAAERVALDRAAERPI